MPPSFFIAVRFVSHHKKAILLSLLGVILGVAFYICAQAQTQGFEQFFIKGALGTSGAITIGNRFQVLHTGILSHAGTGGVLSLGHEKPWKFY